MSLFITSIPTNKILFHQTLIVNSLDLTKQELSELIIQEYKIKKDYKNITISSNYFYNPDYNQIYNVTLEVKYPEEIIIYNLKIKTINNSKTINTNNEILIVLTSMVIITFIIYLLKRKELPPI